MPEHRWTMYIPVLLVLMLSVPLVLVSQWGDFERSKELADEVEKSDNFFSGFTEDTSTTITIIPDTIIDNTIPNSRENINVTDSSGNTTTIEQDTPGRSIFSGLLNAGVMVGIAIASAFGIYKLFTRRKKLTLKLFFLTALGLCASISIMLYLYLFRDFLENAMELIIPRNTLFYIVISGIGLVIGSFIVYNIVFRSLEPKRKNPALIAFCILLGSFLAIVLPVWAVIPLITGVALWDLWAAKRGIIKDMITESDKQRDEIRVARREEIKAMRKMEAIRGYQDPDIQQGAPPHVTGSIPKTNTPKRKKLFDIQPGEDITSYGLYEGKYYSLGIGDFIFFSVLVSSTFKWMMLKSPWMGFYVPVGSEVIAILATVLVMALILLGLKKTLSYLDTENVMPGLPLSVLFGLVGFFGVGIFLEIVNLIFYGGMFQPF